MNEWTKVVTEPLGLAGFALFLVFGYLAKAKKDDERRWLSLVAIALAGRHRSRWSPSLSLVAIALAVIALLGGLSLAYFQPSRSAPLSLRQQRR